MNYGRFREQKKRSLQTSSNHQVKKKARFGAVAPKFRNSKVGACMEFLKWGKCKSWDFCRFNHVTNEGEMVMRANVKGKKPMKV